MKRTKPSIVRILLIVVLVLFVVGFVYDSIGWCSGEVEVMNAVKKRFTIDGQRITGAKYEMVSVTGARGYIQFRVTVENKPEVYTVRVHGIFHRSIYLRRGLHIITGPGMHVQRLEVCGQREYTPDEREPGYWDSVY